jgi:hypothetical protein
MQTVYYSTPNYIRHSGNVVDFNAYRSKLTQADGALALAEPPCPAEPEVPVRSAPTRKGRRVRRTLSEWLDLTATLVLIAVAVTVWIQLMS